MTDKTYDLIKKWLPYFALLGAILVYVGGYWKLPYIDKIGATIDGVVGIVMAWLNEQSKEFFKDKNIVPKENDFNAEEPGGLG